MRHHFVRSSAGLRDPNFKNVTLLLHGNGTNGGQNNTFLDSGPSNFSITRTGNITQGLNNPYGNRWSNYFDGNGDYLTIPAGSAFAYGTGNFTVEGWFFMTAGTQGNYPALMWAQTSGSVDYFFIGVTTTNTIVFNFAATGFGTPVYGPSNSVVQNTWIHFAVVRSGTTATVYVNGIGGTSVTCSQDFTNTSFVPTIGRYTQADAGRFTGYISNLRILKGSAAYTSNFSPPIQPLSAISNTSLLTCQSNRFRDASSNNFSIEYSRFGNTAISRFNPFDQTSPYIKEIYAGSAYFNGSGGQRLTVDNSSGVSLGGANFTIEGWLFNDEYGTRGLVVKPGSWSIYKWGGNIMGRLTTGGVDASIVNFDHPTGGWMHFAFVRDGNTVRLYLNGLQRSSATFTSVVDSSANNIIIGNDGGFNTLNGFLTGIRVTVGTCLYPSGTTFNVPTGPLSALPDTKLLLNFTNASIVDNAMMSNLETVGNAQISTSTKKYGTGALYFNNASATGTNKLVFSNLNLAFGSGDFTVELWAYPTSLWDYQALISSRPDNAGYADAFHIGFNLAGQVVVYSNGNDALTTSNVVTTNNWQHIAVTRSGNTLRIFHNGTVVATNTSYTKTPTRTAFGIGQFSTGNQEAFPGYIDDLRVTKGIARYTSNFTPPTAPFPDF